MSANDQQRSSAIEVRSNKMSALLRIASVLALIQYTIHGAMFLRSIIGHGPARIVEIAASSHHSYWDFYVGYGLLVILSGLIEGVLLWQVASLAKYWPGRVRPIVLLFIFANIAHACLVWRYFSLIAPVAFDVAVATVLVFAFLRVQPNELQTPAHALQRT